MNDFGHSRLLKFFVNPKMADSINEINGIASAVPGEQKIREGDEQPEDNVENIVATKDDFSLSPVITVTKKEATFSKGDLKLQKVTVTEDISDEISTTEDTESMDSMASEDPKTTGATNKANIVNSETGEEVKKVSKIPRLRFRAAVNKIRREQRNDDNVQRKETVTSGNRRRSSIPRLKGNKTPPPKEETEIETKKRESINFDDLISNVSETDFDKIYEEIVEKPIVRDECESTIENEDSAIVDSIFDEIIHAYDVNKIEPLKVDKSKSKIPLLKRKSEHDIEVKKVRKEYQRKGSLGRIPISNSFSNKDSGLPKIKIPQANNGEDSLYKLDTQSNNDENSLSKRDTEATNSDNNTNSNLETDDNCNVTNPIVTVTTVPLGQNKYTNISSIVLNKQPIRVNLEEDNQLMQMSHDDDADTGLVSPKFEEISVMEAVIDESPMSSHLDDSVELNFSIKTKNNSEDEDVNEYDIKKIEDSAIDDYKSKEINVINEKVLYDIEAKINNDTNTKSSQLEKTYYNYDYNSTSNEIPKTGLKSLEPEREHENELKIISDLTFKKDLPKESIVTPKLNETEAIIRYKPNVREVEVTKEPSYTNYYNTNHSIYNSNNVDYENKRIHRNESLISKPIKYKTISASQTVEEANEEDIIILKGKVNRVISRLDSIEPKPKKTPLNDLPKQSVKSKISIFECNDPKPAVTRTISSNSNLIHAKDDKPRVVEGILKESKNIDDLDKRKAFASLENNLVNDQIKIAYGLKDELARWERDNTRHSAHRKTACTEYGLPKNNTNELITDINSTHNNDISAKEDDVFAKKSAEIINSYKLSQEKKKVNVESDMKRAKSLAELDLGDAVTGKVKKMVHRMKSVDKIEHRKDIINSRERPRKGSVSERIALFEGRVPKAAPVKMSLHEMINSSPAALDNSERLAELAAAAAKYGTFQNISRVEVGGMDVPALWVGTAMIESGVTKELIKAAIDLGYRAFDTAHIYGTEREVGEAIREKIADGTVKREELFVAGKLWSTFHRTDLVEPACRESLDKLGLDYFDLYMIHNPMSFKEGGHPIPTIANVLQYSEHDYLDAWFGIEGVVRKGLARAAGVSNFNTSQIQRILDKGKIRPVVNQVESHPYLTQLGLADFCSAHNIRLSVFGTLGSKGTPAPFKSDLAPAIDDPLVVTMAAGLGVTPAQLLISYQLSLGRAVVVKCSSGARLWENLQAQAQAAALRPEHVRALHNLNRNQRTFTFRGMGDTHKNYPFTELL